MTSIAAYLASLTGAAPKEGQTATPANAAGGGLFAALLQTNGFVQVTEGEVTLPIAQPGLPAVTVEGQVDAQAQAESATLREALTGGLDLPKDGADVEAAIIEYPLPDEAILDETQLLQVPQDAETQLSAQIHVPVQDTPPSTEPAPVPTAILKESASETVDEALVKTAPETQTVPAEVQKQQPQQTAEKPSPAHAILENVLDRASQQGRENGLQTALSRTAQARGGADGQLQGPALPGNAGSTGEAGLKATAESRNINQPNPQGAAQAERAPDPAHTRVAGDTPIKAAADRPEFAPKAPEIVQRLIKSGNGQTLIQIHSSTGGDNSGVSSPPTLTVNVQAPAASPSPATANAPHVPVSALAVHIANQANNGARRFDIRLDPPELGRIEVRLDVSREGQVMTHLVVERAETLDLLQRDARQLERALQDAGLDTSEDGMKFSLKDQGLAHDGDGFDGEDEMGNAAPGGADEEQPRIADEDMPPPTRYMATTGLDIRI